MDAFGKTFFHPIHSPFFVSFQRLWLVSLLQAYIESNYICRFFYRPIWTGVRFPPSPHQTKFRLLPVFCLTLELGASNLHCSRRESKAGALCEFCEAKTNIARRGREKFSLENLFVTDSRHLHKIKTPVWCFYFTFSSITCSVIF